MPRTSNEAIETIEIEETGSLQEIEKSGGRHYQFHSRSPQIVMNLFVEIPEDGNEGSLIRRYPNAKIRVAIEIDSESTDIELPES